MSEDLEVAVCLPRGTVVAGRARVDSRRGRTTTSFSYAPDYLADPDAYPLDPALPFDTGGGFVAGLPGAFADCAPDRWGRGLIRKRIRATERREDRGAPRTLTEVDYLMGVSDATRQGALRFRRAGSPAFEHTDTEVPTRIRLPELLRAADRVTRDDDEDLSAVKILLGAGTGTIGGARPKASVLGDDGALYIAKFPHTQDEWDVMAWEKTALDLAERVGIDVPERAVTTVAGRSVLLVRRFDRVLGATTSGRGPAGHAATRVGYMSAMTVVGGADGGDHDYLDLGADLSDLSGAADSDLRSLWGRIAFSSLIHNTDDHLRNHGLLRGPKGWRLSPVFDVNPNPDVSEGRATAISGATERSEEVEALLLAAPDFSLSRTRAREQLREMVSATADWPAVAASNGASAAEIARFHDAFEGLRSQFEGS